ncbi:MAG: aminoglycoside phosphotransferase family protein [Treponema sp.]|nr:aminoglycoside phosphotransferase family protein [Treponema sp.]
MININKLPFFQNKLIELQESIYSNDAYPSCFLVSEGICNYKVRLSSSFNPYAIIREYNALEYLKKQGSKLGADILEAKIDGPPESLYLIESFLPGKSLEKYSTDELEKYMPLLTQKISSCLYELHNLKGHKFHSFIGDSYQTYLDMLETHMQRHIRTIGTYDINFANYISKTIKNIHLYEYYWINITPSFLHFDLKPQNIIFDKETTSISLVDFEFARFGDMFHELIRAKMRFSQNTLFFRNLWSHVENCYFQKIGHIPSVKELIYQLYYYVSDLPYYYKINDFNNIICLQEKIKETLIDLE